MGDNMLPYTIWDGVYGDYEDSITSHPMLEELNKQDIDFETWAHNCLNQDDLEDAVANPNKHRKLVIWNRSCPRTASLNHSFRDGRADEPMTRRRHGWHRRHPLPGRRGLHGMGDHGVDVELLSVSPRTFRPDDHGNSILCILSRVSA